MIIIIIIKIKNGFLYIYLMAYISHKSKIDKGDREVKGRERGRKEK
jgi:hypothetical protein